jgi:hypothetical protein
MKESIFNKLLPFLSVCVLLMFGCTEGAIEPELKTPLVVMVVFLSFFVIFTKPILGVYVATAISATFSPPIHVGFANLYFHQWIILIAFLASISSGLILGNLHAKLKSDVNVPIMVFIGSLLLSMGHAPNMIIGIKSFLYIGVLIASYYLVVLSVNREQQVRIFVGLLIAVTSFICLISLSFHTSGRLGSVGVAGAFGLGNPNSYGNFLALVIPLCISLLFYGGISGKRRFILVVSFTLLLVSLCFTFSRSAWIGVFAGILSLSVLRPRKLLFLLLCAIIGAVFLVSPIHKRTFEDISDPGAEYRLVKAKIAYARFKENPIMGNGLGSFHYEAQFSNVWAYRAHSTLENNYLLMLAEGGIIEFLAFVYLMVIFGKKVITLLKRVREPFLYAALLGCVASIISTLAAGMFEDTLFFPKNNWLIGMFMGIAVVIERIHGESSKIPQGDAEEID